MGKDIVRRAFPSMVVTSVLMMLCATLMALAFSGFQPSEAVAEDGPDYDIGWYLDNQASDEFEISTPSELRGLAKLVNGAAVDASGAAVPAESFAGKTVYLWDTSNNTAATIDLSAVEFVPIGTEEHPFAGTFDGAPDGQSGEIRNLKITNTFAHAGLFGYASASSTLKDITLINGEQGGITLSTDSTKIEHVGSLVGQTDGLVTGCESDVQVSVDSTLQSTEAVPFTVQNVGGLVGYAHGDIQSCAYLGGLDITVGADVLDPDTSSDSLRVADSFGGVVGRFGDPKQHGTLTDSYNLADVVVKTTGDGGSDRFGTDTYAVAFFVGGVAGYSNGSILRCHNGAYNELTHAVTGRVFTGVEANGVLQNNRGADQVGGIAGSLRGESDDPNKYNDGDPNDPMLVEDCYNEAQVTGLCAVGGIVGQTGVYCTITKCYNGFVTDLEDWQANQVAGKVVSTRWNKPFSGGIAGQCRSGNITYCANYAEVRNIQTGYYMAGIVGGLFISDDYPNVTGQVYSCLNTGGVYTINESKNVEYREAGICGQNEGYVHDCIVLAGSVPYHSDSPIGNMDWGAADKLEIWDSNELQHAESAAFLNAIAAQEQDWSCYWFVNGVGYPVLNSWANLADDQRILLTADNVASCEQIAPAPFTGEGTSSLPTLQVTLADGTVLVQNADFRVLPQVGAWEMNGSYTAGIEGLGRYRGVVENCAGYTIGAGDLALSTVLIAPQKYAFGAVVLPVSVEALINGNLIDSSEYDVVVYNSATSAQNVVSGKNAFAVYDSAGYVSYDAAGSNLVPVSSVGVEQLNASERAWWLWNRNREKISDSAGNSYYTSSSGGVPGQSYGAMTSCVKLKSGSPAGYVVQVSAKASSTVLTGSAIGYYVIDPVDLYRECTFEQATIDDQVWYWDADTATFYKKDALGNRIDEPVSVVFTGRSIEPQVKVSYNGRELVAGTDYRLLYGDPVPSEGGGTVMSEEDANRNITTATTRNALTIAPIDTMNLSNYINAYFRIEPARFEDCEITLADEEWAYTGEAITPPVTVKLNGVKLKKGTDFEVTYADNVEQGTAHYTVSPLDNLSGGSTESFAGEFTIVEGASIGDFTVADIPDQQFNYGYDVHPPLSFSDAGGAVVNLVEGVDYTVSYSTKQITKWSDDDRANPCVATITGKGRYAGSLQASFDIVPYDATANVTNQLRVDVQDMAYGTWGKPGTRKTLSDGSVVFREPTANFGAEYYPVVSVRALPIVDWAAYAAGDYNACYGNAIALTNSTGGSSRDYGSLIPLYPARYFDASGAEVTGNGNVLLDNDNGLIAAPALAEPGTFTVEVYLQTGTSGNRGGAVGCLTTSFEYNGPVALSTATWSPSDNNARTYTGSPLAPIVGKTISGMVLVEGVDYSIDYTDNVDVGEASFAVSSIDGNAHFSGSYTGSFTVLPYDLVSGEEVSIDPIADQTLEDGQDAVEPHPVVRRGDVVLEEDVDYLLSYRNNKAAGEATARVTGTGNYSGYRDITFTIEGAAPPAADKKTQTISGKASFSKTYGDAAFSLGASTDGDGALSYASDYTKVAKVSSDGKVSIAGAGNATITITAAETDACKKATKTVKVTVAKAANPLTAKAKAKTVTVKYAKLKKKAQTIKPANAIAVSKAQGAVTYAKASGNKKITVAKNGKFTVKKGLKKGTYTVKVKVTAAGNANYKNLTKTIAVKIKVK